MSAEKSISYWRIFQPTTFGFESANVSLLLTLHYFSLKDTFLIVLKINLQAFIKYKAIKYICQQLNCLGMSAAIQCLIKQNFLQKF